MPCDYSKYPANWKTVIRPAILERDEHRCKFCNVPNYTAVFRGFITNGNGRTEVYQTGDGKIFDANDGRQLHDGSVLVYVHPQSGKEDQQAIKIILTIMHLDHDVTNNNYENLAAGCQRCHLKHDKGQHKATKKKNKGIQELF